MYVKIVLGDDAYLPVNLLKDGNSFIISEAATVQAVLKSKNTALSSIVTCLSNTPGADWTLSKVVCPFTSAVTEAITFNGNTQACELEIQVNDNGVKQTWVVDGITLEKGIIP
jgi:hypothetical protein